MKKPPMTQAQAYQMHKKTGSEHGFGEVMNGANRKQRRAMAKMQRQQDPEGFVKGLSSHKVRA